MIVHGADGDDGGDGGDNCGDGDNVDDDGDNYQYGNDYDDLFFFCYSYKRLVNDNLKKRRPTNSTA